MQCTLCNDNLHRSLIKNFNIEANCWKWPNSVKNVEKILIFLHGNFPGSREKCFIFPRFPGKKFGGKLPTLLGYIANEMLNYVGMYFCVIVLLKALQIG